MLNKLRTKRGAGFTLIELMIVIAIIGILAAIAVPNFNRARAQAKKKSCVSNMKTMEGAIELYQMENSIPAGTAPSVTDLKTKGYLKTEPKCPGSGTYAIAMPSGTNAVTDITCTIHGSLQAQDGADKDKGL